MSESDIKETNDIKTKTGIILVDMEFVVVFTCRLPKQLVLESNKTYDEIIKVKKDVRLQVNEKRAF